MLLIEALANFKSVNHLKGIELTLGLLLNLQVNIDEEMVQDLEKARDDLRSYFERNNIENSNISSSKRHHDQFVSLISELVLPKKD